MSKFFHRGWIRLWLVVTIVGVPAFAEVQFVQMKNVWAGLDAMTVKRCVDEEYNRPSHPDAMECGKKDGMFQTVFEREGTTASAWWTGALFVSLLFDIVITGLLMAVFLAGRWVWRGFRSNSSRHSNISTTDTTDTNL